MKRKTFLEAAEQFSMDKQAGVGSLLSKGVKAIGNKAKSTAKSVNKHINKKPDKVKRILDDIDAKNSLGAKASKRIKDIRSAKKTLGVKKPSLKTTKNSPKVDSSDAYRAFKRGRKNFKNNKS